MAEKPTNIEKVSDLIDLDIQSGETVEIEDPTPNDADIAVEFNPDGSAELNYFPDEAEEQVPFECPIPKFFC